jgi:hypothetical protein
VTAIAVYSPSVWDSETQPRAVGHLLRGGGPPGRTGQPTVDHVEQSEMRPRAQLGHAETRLVTASLNHVRDGGGLGELAGPELPECHVVDGDDPLRSTNRNLDVRVANLAKCG